VGGSLWAAEAGGGTWGVPEILNLLPEPTHPWPLLNLWGI